jgi:hypothetical protein
MFLSAIKKYFKYSSVEQTVRLYCFEVNQMAMGSIVNDYTIVWVSVPFLTAVVKTV